MAAIFETISTVYQNPLVSVSVTIGAPAGLVVGELMVVAGIADTDVPATITFPAGWTKTDESNPAIGNPVGFLGFKVATAPDLGASFIFSHSGVRVGAWNIGIKRLSAHAGTDAFGVTTINDVPGLNPSLPSFVTIADNVLVVRFAGWVNTGAEPTFTGPVAGHTTRAQNGGPFDPGSPDTNGFWCTRNAIVSPPGLVGASTVPQDGGGNTRAVAYSLGIAPFLGTIVPVGQAQETNLAQPIVRNLPVPVLQATEINVALPMFTIDFFPFLTITEADERCELKMESGDWVVCHSQRILDGQIAVRFQRFMSPLNPDFGKWETLIDKTIN
jgi:hypothetical protein